ncbi:hypothetical protein L3V86_06555 [Thiotrichales bacterium 19S11-10]|nr:hypothetical protein [Thiotrichales bacterium 19S11-10]
MQYCVYMISKALQDIKAEDKEFVNIALGLYKMNITLANEFISSIYMQGRINNQGIIQLYKIAESIQSHLTESHQNIDKYHLAEVKKSLPKLKLLGKAGVYLISKDYAPTLQVENPFLETSASYEVEQNSPGVQN